MVMAAVRLCGGALRRAAVWPARTVAEVDAEATGEGITTVPAESASGCSSRAVAADTCLGGTRFGRCLVRIGRFAVFLGTEGLSPLS